MYFATRIHQGERHFTERIKEMMCCIFLTCRTMEVLENEVQVEVVMMMHFSVRIKRMKVVHMMTMKDLQQEWLSNNRMVIMMREVRMIKERLQGKVYYKRNRMEMTKMKAGDFNYIGVW